MRLFILPLLLATSFTCLAQFPAPVNFDFTYVYNNSGSLLCNGEPLPLYGYCSTFSWEAPDVSSTTAELVSYTIYHEDLYTSTVDEVGLHGDLRSVLDTFPECGELRDMLGCTHGWHE